MHFLKAVYQAEIHGVANNGQPGGQPVRRLSLLA